MEFVTSSHRNGLALIESDPDLGSLWQELIKVLQSISDEEILMKFRNNAREAKSISEAINDLIDENLIGKSWERQSRIFKKREYESKTWTLDFSKSIKRKDGSLTGVAVEVAFNHGEAIAWNLIKPSLAAEINHLEKETDIGSGIGVFICASKALKDAGGFDNAVGEYEKVLKYLTPLAQMIATPLIIVGLQAPASFRIEPVLDKSKNKKIGKVVEYKL
jgi:hypothetical protein